MKRRRLLAALGGSLALAGCLSRGSTPGSGPTDTPTSGDTDPAPTATPTPSGASEVTATGTPGPGGTSSSDGFVLGEATGDVNPHGLTLQNEGDVPRTVELTVSDADTDETLLDRSYSLDAGEDVSGELRGPATYDVHVVLPEEGTEHATTVGYFDTCNSYGTSVTIDADGSITSRTIRTLVACDPEATPPPDGFTIGETTGEVNPHQLAVYNRGDTTRTVELRITDADADETLMDRTHVLDAGGNLSGTLRGPATYEVRVAVPEAGTEAITTVDYFDTCNDYGTNAAIDADGSVSLETFRTDALCGSD